MLECGIMIVLTVYVTLKPETIDPAIDACRIVRSHSITEHGCERYDFYQSPDDKAKVVFVEEWSSKADLELHFQQKAFQEFVATMTPFYQSPSEIRIFESSLLG